MRALILHIGGPREGLAPDPAPGESIIHYVVPLESLKAMLFGTESDALFPVATRSTSGTYYRRTFTATGPRPRQRRDVLVHHTMTAGDLDRRVGEILARLYFSGKIEITEGEQQ
jgi:hypothetical protein